MSYKKAVQRLGCIAFMLLFAKASWGGEGLFQAPQSYASGAGYAYSIAVGDVNGDGKPDMLSGRSCTRTHPCSGIR